MPSLSIFSLAALAVLLATPALAQPSSSDGPPPGPGADARYGRMRGSWDPTAMREHMQARRAERLKALHDVLNIHPGQEAAFATFTTAMQPVDAERGLGGKRPEPETMASLTTPERLDRLGVMMEQHWTRRHEAFQRRAGAAKALYAALTPDQRRTMDALPELRGGGRWGHGGGRGMGPGGGMKEHGPNRIGE